MFDETSSGVNFISQYKNISNKLKKRFLRKTNVAEPSDQFAALAVQCEKNELPEYAGISWLGVASCEASLGHKSEESAAYANAGRQFINAENSTLIGCNVLSRTGEWCLGQSRRICEAVDKTKVVGGSNVYSSLALLPSLRSPGSHTRLHDLDILSSKQISIGDYEGALKSFSEMVSTVRSVTLEPFGVYIDILIRCEVCRLLLILVLSPTPQRLDPELAKLIEKYTWIGEPDPQTKRLLGVELFFLLQSLVMSCQSQDIEAVMDIESDLSSHLDPQQKELLSEIINRGQHISL